MTHAEFETLSGIVISEAEYHNNVEPLYYSTHGECSDNEPFCRELAKIWDNPLFAEMLDKFNLYKNCKDIYFREDREDAELLLKKGIIYNDKEMLARAEKRLGKVEVIKIKLRNSWTLTDEEKDIIINNLK